MGFNKEYTMEVFQFPKFYKFLILTVFKFDNIRK